MSEKTKKTELTTTDYAFLAVRGLVILGGMLWLAFEPHPVAYKENLFYIFSTFVLYSVILAFVALKTNFKLEKVYLVAQAMDLFFFGLFVKFSGGMESDVYVAMYLLVALHSYYYGIMRGLALALLCSIVYVSVVQGQWGDHTLNDLFMRLSVLFLISGFLGFLSEKARHDKHELVRTHMELKELQKRLVNAYRNLRDVKKQVAQSEKLASVGKLAAELAHEINNPLDGIKNCLSVFKDPDGDEEQKKRYLALIEEGLKDIEDVVKNLLEYVKKHEFKEEPVDLNALLSRTLIMMDCKFRRQKIRLRKALHEPLPPVMGDTHHLQQVFFNLMLNAVDAMPDGGTLTVESAPVGDHVVVKITDTGIGIPKAMIKNIFQPFYTTKSDGKGTGLGLPISLDIVEKHGGTMDVYSFQGMGTTFKVSIKAMESAKVLAMGDYKS